MSTVMKRGIRMLLVISALVLGVTGCQNTTENDEAPEEPTSFQINVVLEENTDFYGMALEHYLNDEFDGDQMVTNADYSALEGTLDFDVPFEAGEYTFEFFVAVSPEEARQANESMSTDHLESLATIETPLRPEANQTYVYTLKKHGNDYTLEGPES